MRTDSMIQSLARTALVGIRRAKWGLGVLLVAAAIGVISGPGTKAATYTFSGYASLENQDGSSAGVLYIYGVFVPVYTYTENANSYFWYDARCVLDQYGNVNYDCKAGPDYFAPYSIYYTQETPTDSHSLSTANTPTTSLTAGYSTWIAGSMEASVNGWDTPYWTYASGTFATGFSGYTNENWDYYAGTLSLRIWGDFYADVNTSEGMSFEFIVDDNS